MQHWLGYLYSFDELVLGCLYCQTSSAAKLNQDESYEPYYLTDRYHIHLGYKVLQTGYRLA